VDESSQRVRRNNSQQPQNEKDDKNCPKHRSPPREFISAHKDALTPRSKCRLFASRPAKKNVWAQPAKTVPHFPRHRIEMQQISTSRKPLCARGGGMTRDDGISAGSSRVRGAPRIVNAHRIGGQCAAHHHSHLAHYGIWVRRLSRRAGLGILRWGKRQPHSHHRSNSAAAQSDLKSGCTQASARTEA
jgi:hypothetical protein